MEEKENLYFFGIGIDNYLNLPNLSSAVREINDFQHILEKRYQLSNHFSISIFNELATKHNILETLSELSRKISENDSLIIYYSGHGEFDRNLDRAYWIPHEGSSNNQTSGISNAIIID